MGIQGPAHAWTASAPAIWNTSAHDTRGNSSCTGERVRTAVGVRGCIGRGLDAQQASVSDVGIHFVILMIRWTGLALWGLNSLFQVALHLPC